MKKKIYCFINVTYASGDMLVESLCEDGTFLSQHFSSSVSFAKHDIGINSDWQHDKYKEHCPEGFELIWVDDPEDSEEMNAAYEIHLSKNEIVQD